MSKARSAGGKEYAELCALAYRQTIAANKLVRGNKKELLYFNRELGTIDVFAPSAPLFLYFNPELVKAFMNPLFEYSEWQMAKAYPAHDLGIYRLSVIKISSICRRRRQEYVDSNAAVTAAEGNGEYAAKHWEILTRWNNYLVQNGIDTKISHPQILLQN